MKAISLIHSSRVANRLLLESPAVQQSFGFPRSQCVDERPGWVANERDIYLV